MPLQYTLRMLRILLGSYFSLPYLSIYYTEISKTCSKFANHLLYGKIPIHYLMYLYIKEKSYGKRKKVKNEISQCSYTA